MSFKKPNLLFSRIVLFPQEKKLSPLNSSDEENLKKTFGFTLALILHSDFLKYSDLIEHQRKHCIRSVKTEIEQKYLFSKDNSWDKSKSALYIKTPTNIFSFNL